MTWYSECSQCWRWFHCIIHSIIYGDPHPPIPPTVYMATQTYYHPTSPTKRSSRNTENIDDFNIV